MKQLILIIAFLGGSGILNAQFQWTRTYHGDTGDYDYYYVYDMVTDGNGNTYVTGYTKNLYIRGMTTIKYGPNGDSLWVKLYEPASELTIYGSAIAIDPAGNIIVLGEWGSQDKTLLVKYTPSGDGALQKYDSTGTLTFEKELSHDTANVDFGDIELDEAGNVYISTGVWKGNQSVNFPQYHEMLVKYTRQGDLSWKQEYQVGYFHQESMGIDHNGYIYVTGTSKDTSLLTFVYTNKYDTSGNFVWNKIFAGSHATTRGTQARKISVDGHGNAYVAGLEYYGSHPSKRLLYIQYSETGDTLASYLHTYGFTCYITEVLDITHDNHGRVFLLSKNDVGALCRDEWRLSLYKDVLTNVSQVSTNAPDKFRLYNNYPNPFNPTSTIRFDIPYGTDVKLKVYDMLGREIAELVNSRLEAGTYQYNWDGGSFATGMYLYRLETPEYTVTKKMVLIK
jgi:hypothetical protein